MGRAQRGDEDAFAALIDRFDRRLLYYVRRLMNEEDGAFDVVQSTWLAAYRRLDRHRSPNAFRVWLFRIAHDQAVSVLRRKGLPITSTDSQPIEPSDEQKHSVEGVVQNAQLVHKALGRLSFEHRQILTLRFLEDMTIEEIAAVTCIPVGTVKSRLHYRTVLVRLMLKSTSVDSGRRGLLPSRLAHRRVFQTS